MIQKTINILETLATAKEEDNYKNWFASTISNMTVAEYKDFHAEIKKLIHHRDTTVGLWATDRPDLVIDDQSVLFKIE